MAEERQELQYLLGADATQLLHVFNKVMKSADNMELSVIKAVEKMSNKSADSLDDFAAALKRYDEQLKSTAKNASHNGLERLTDKQTEALNNLISTYDEYLTAKKRALDPNYEKEATASAQALAVANSLAAKVVNKEMSLANIRSYTKSLQTYMDKAAQGALTGKQKSAFNNVRSVMQKALKDFTVIDQNGQVDRAATAQAKRAAAISFRNFQKAYAEGAITEGGKNYKEKRVVGSAAKSRIDNIEKHVLNAMTGSKWVASEEVKKRLSDNIKNMLSDAFARSMVTMDDLANMEQTLSSGKSSSDVIKNLAEAYNIVKTNARDADKQVYQDFLNEYQGLVDAQTKAALGDAHKLTGEQTKMLNTTIAHAITKGRKELEEYAQKLYLVMSRRVGPETASEMTKLQVDALDKDLKAGTITDETIKDFNDALDYTLKGKMRMVVDKLTEKYGDLQGYTGSKGTLSDGMINSISKQEEKKLKEIIKEGQRLALSIDEETYRNKSFNILKSVSERMKAISVEAADSYADALDRILSSKKLDFSLSNEELIKQFPELGNKPKNDENVTDQSLNARPLIETISRAIDPKALGADKESLLKKLEELRQVAMRHYKAFTTDKKPTEEGAKAYANKLFPEVPEGLNVQQIQEYIMRKIATADMWSYIQNSRPNKAKNMYPYFGTHLQMDKGTSWGSKNIKLYDGGDRGLITDYKASTDKSAYKTRIELSRQLIRTYNKQHQEKLAAAKASYEKEIDDILKELVGKKAKTEASKYADSQVNNRKAAYLGDTEYGDLMSKATAFAQDKYKNRKRKTSDPDKRARELQKYIDKYLQKALKNISNDNFTEEQLAEFEGLYKESYQKKYDETTKNTDTSQYLSKAKLLQEQRQQQREYEIQEAARLRREQRDQSFVDSVKAKQNQVKEEIAATKKLEATQEKIKRNTFAKSYMEENNLSGLSGGKQAILAYRKYNAQQQYEKNKIPSIDEDLPIVSKEVTTNFQELTQTIMALTSHVHRLAQSIEKLVYNSNLQSGATDKARVAKSPQTAKAKAVKEAINQAKLYSDGDTVEFDRILDLLLKQIQAGKLQGLPENETNEKLMSMAREAVKEKDLRRTSRTKKEQDERNKAIAMLIAHAKDTVTDTNELAARVAELEALRTSDKPIKSSAEIRADIEAYKAKEYINPVRPSKQILPSDLQDLKATEADTKRQENLYRSVDGMVKRFIDNMAKNSSTMTKEDLDRAISDFKGTLRDILAGERSPDSAAKASLEASLQKLSQMQSQGTITTRSGVEKPLDFKEDEVQLTGMAAALDNIKKSIDKVKKKYQELFGIVDSTQDKTNNKIKKGAKKTASDVEQYFKRTASITSGILISQAFRTVANTIRNASSELIRFVNEMDSVNIAYEVMLGNAEQANAVVFEIQKLAATTPYEVETSLTGIRKLLAYGYNAGEALTIMRKSADAIAVSGDDATAMNSLIEALGQIKVKGKLAGQQLRQLYSAGIPINDFFKEEMGWSGKELAKKVSAGAVDANTAVNVILDGITKRFPDGAKKMNRTISGLMSNIADSLRYLGTTLVSDVTEMFKDGLESVASTLEKLWDVSKNFGAGGLFEAIVPKEYHSTIRHTIGYLKVIGDSIKTIMLNSGFLKHVLYSTFKVLNPVLNAIALVAGSVAAAIKKLNENASTRKLVEGFTKLLGIVIGLTVIGKVSTMFFKFLSMTTKLLGVHSMIKTVVVGFGVLTGAVTDTSKAVQGLNTVCTFLAKNPLVMVIGAMVGGLYALGSIADVVTAKFGAMAKILMWIPSAVYKTFNWLFGAISNGFNQLYKKLFNMDFGSILMPKDIDMDAYYKALQDAMGITSEGADDAADSMDDATESAKNYLQAFDEVFTIDPDDGDDDSGSGTDTNIGLPDIGDYMGDPELPDISGEIDDIEPPNWGDILGIGALVAAIAAILKKYKKWRDEHKNTKKELEGNPIKVPVEAPVTENIFEKLKNKVKEWNKGFQKNPIKVPVFVPDIEGQMGKVRDKINQWKEKFGQSPIPVPVYATEPNFEPVLNAYKQAKLALNPIPIAVTVAAPVMQHVLNTYEKLKAALKPVPVTVEVEEPDVSPVMNAYDTITGAAPIAGTVAATQLVGQFDKNLKEPNTSPVRNALDKMREAARTTGKTTAEVYIGTMDSNIRVPNLSPVTNAGNATKEQMTTTGALTGVAYGSQLLTNVDNHARRLPSIFQGNNAEAVNNTAKSLGTRWGETMGTLAADMSSLKMNQRIPVATGDDLTKRTFTALGILLAGTAGAAFGPQIASSVATGVTGAANSANGSWSITTAFKSLGQWVGGLFGDGLLSGLKNMGSNIVTWFKNLFSFGGGGAGGGLKPVLPFSLAPQGVAPAAMSLPGYSRGGIITKAHVAMVGEGNKREVVIPLENSGAMAPFADAVADRLAKRTAGSSNNESGDVVLNVGVLVADDNGLRQLERKLQTVRKQETRRS